MSGFLYRRRLPSAEKSNDTNDGKAIQMHSVRDLEQHLNILKKENFSLKLRIYFLEENLRDQNEDHDHRLVQDQNQMLDQDQVHLKDIHRQNAELQQRNYEMSQEIGRLLASLLTWEEKEVEFERRRAELEQDKEHLEVKLHNQEAELRVLQEAQREQLEEDRGRMNCSDFWKENILRQQRHPEDQHPTKVAVRDPCYENEAEPDEKNLELDHSGSNPEFDNLGSCNVPSGTPSKEEEGEEQAGLRDDCPRKWAALVQSQARELVKLRRRQEVGVGLCGMLTHLLEDVSCSLEEQLPDQKAGQSLQDLLRRVGATARRLQDRILGRYDDHDDHVDQMLHKRQSPENNSLINDFQAHLAVSPTLSDQSESFSYVSDTESHNNARELDTGWSTAQVAAEWMLPSGGPTPDTFWNAHEASTTSTQIVSIAGHSELGEKYWLQRRHSEAREEAELPQGSLLEHCKQKERVEIGQEHILSWNRVVGGAKLLAALGRSLLSCSDLIGPMELRLLELHQWRELKCGRELQSIVAELRKTLHQANALLGCVWKETHQQSLENPRSLKLDEEFIVRQLCRTRDVLTRAKQNLQAKKSHAYVRSLVVGPW